MIHTPDSPYKAVLFDLDGTLVDSAGELISSVNLLLKYHGQDPLPYTQLRPYASDGSRGLIKQAFAIDETNANFASLRKEYLVIYQKMLREEDHPVCLFPGCAELLTILDTENIPWGIVTNKPRYLTEIMLRQSTQEIALVFGRERSGLTNEELDLCQRSIMIPTASDFHSLKSQQRKEGF